MKFIDLTIALIQQVVGSWIDQARSELSKLYISAIDHTRHAFLALWLAILGIIAAFSGFLMLHIALFLYFSWTLQTKAIILLVLGLIYLLVPTVIISRLLSRRRWLKAFGAESSSKKMHDK